VLTSSDSEDHDENGKVKHRVVMHQLKAIKNKELKENIKK